MKPKWEINGIMNKHTTYKRTINRVNSSFQLRIIHYENRAMQYTANFHSCKNENFQFNFFDYFHIFAQNILWVHVRTASMRRLLRVPTIYALQQK